MGLGVDDPDHTTRDTAYSTSSIPQLPQFPGDEFRAHEAAAWLEQAQPRLGRLLHVAQGHEPPAATAIRDIDLSTLPALPETHRDHNRRLELRIKVQAQNDANATRRFTITMEAWTDLYVALKACTEKSAPLFSRQLKEACDLSVTHGVAGGYQDGPRAWRAVLGKLTGDERTEADKDFYRTAERLQRASRLPDGCPAIEYSKKALAFLIHIRPHLAQTYDDEQTSGYLIDLMPHALRGDGRRLKTELRAAGRYLDHMRTSSRAAGHSCRKSRKAQPQVPHS